MIGTAGAPFFVNDVTPPPEWNESKFSPSPYAVSWVSSVLAVLAAAKTSTIMFRLLPAAIRRSLLQERLRRAGGHQQLAPLLGVDRQQVISCVSLPSRKFLKLCSAQYLQHKPARRCVPARAGPEQALGAAPSQDEAVE